VAWPDFSPSAALRALVQAGVDFVVIGGIAAVAHGGAQLTQDLDIVPAPDDLNFEVLGRTLISLDARLRGVADEIPFVPDGRTLRHTEILCLDTKVGPLDVLRAPKAAPRYPDLRSAALRVLIGDSPVLIASIEDLIAMKLAAGRPKDMVAVEELEAIRRLTGSARR
jgi:predicted nucleotidyltransferase